MIDRAASLLRDGRLVAFPTETVYGLGADATDEAAVARLFEVKGRPRFNPLISHLPSVEAALAHGDFRDTALRLAEAFWPGPLTLVVRRAEGCPIAWLTSAGLDTVALRVPGLPSARALLAAAGRPIAAPSANRSGRVSPTTAAHVDAEFGEDVALVLDGGPTAVGLESTVVDVSGERAVLLRPGAVTSEMLVPITGPLARPAASAPIASPGMLESHYAPAAPVRLDATELRPGEAYLGFGPIPASLGPGREYLANLSPGGDLVEAASNLFAMLRSLDRPGVAVIAVAPIPETGIGAAIADRLRRAAAPRGSSNRVPPTA